MLVLVALALVIAPATAGASLKSLPGRAASSSRSRATAARRSRGAKAAARARPSCAATASRTARTIGAHHIGRHIAPDVAYGRDEVVLPNGTHYALQRIRRLGQFGQLGAPELRFARWRGAQPRLSLTGEWAYNGRFPRICGTATYHGRAFFGGPTRSAAGRSTRSGATSTSTSCAAAAGSASWACSRARAASRS